MDESLIDFENKLVNSIRINHPDIFDQLPSSDSLEMAESLNYIVKKYNSAVENTRSITSEFNAIRDLASAKNAKYASVFSSIGQQLEIGTPPTIKQIFHASNFIIGSTDKVRASKIIDIENRQLTTIIIRKMVEWPNTPNILSIKEVNYIADFAYGLKSLNQFHEKNIRRHLKKLCEHGFNS